MEVILRQDIEKVGLRGEVVDVAPGFAGGTVLLVPVDVNVGADADGVTVVDDAGPHPFAFCARTVTA